MSELASRATRLSRQRFSAALIAACVAWACQSDPTSQGGQGGSPATQSTAGNGQGGSPVVNDASDTHAGSAGEATTDATVPALDAALSYPQLDGGACVPGVPRCHGDFGYQQCEQDGTWGPPHSCAGYSSDGTSSYCVMTPGTDTNEPWAACVDPACWYWITRGFVPGPTSVGVCTSSTTIRQCNAGGTLSSETCAGVCTQVGVLDGRNLGYCSDQCNEGARECLGGALYRECQDGRWLAEPKVCDGGQICTPVGSGAIPEIRCGGACDPGTSRCASDGASIEVCNEEQQWTAGQMCMVGTCRPAGPQAQCQAECLTDQFDCAHDGATTQRSCDELRHWTPPSACPEATSCRISASQSLGCVECLGPLTAGNDYGVSDSRCEAGGVARCGEDNAWMPAVACANGETCSELSSGASRVAYCQP
jgi:hypothetical protein